MGVYRVMIVDDEPWALVGLKNAVDWESLGYEICYCTQSSRDALQKIADMKPDIVLTDIRMPELSGLQLIHECRSVGATCEFIVVSGFEDFLYAQEALNLGAFYYLLKPIDRQEMTSVVTRVTQLLESKQAVRLLQMNERMRRIITGEDQSATFRDLFPEEAQDEKCAGLVVIQESPLEDLRLRIFGANVATEALRIGSNRIVYVASAAEDVAFYDWNVLESLLEIGVSFATSDLFASDTPVFRVISQAEKKLREGDLLHGGGEAETNESGLCEPRRSKTGEISKIIGYIDEHYAEPLSLETISAQFHFSFSHICHMFRREMGVTFLDYLTELRMSKALDLLLNTRDSVGEIATKVGYQDYYYFCRVFKRRYQKTPASYRKAVTTH